jgi:hypothetical protein
MIVSSLFTITLSALPSISIVASSSLIPNWSVINVAQVTVAISFKISFFLSPNPGALTATTLSIHLILLRISEAKASHSTSSAIKSISFFPVAAIDSKS